MIAQLLSLHPAAGGLAGFHVATDLLQLDFSPPQEAPEEFRAMTFNAPQAAKGKLPTPGEPGGGPSPARCMFNAAGHSHGCTAMQPGCLGQAAHSRRARWAADWGGVPNALQQRLPANTDRVRSQAGLAIMSCLPCILAAEGSLGTSRGAMLCLSTHHSAVQARC